MKFPREYYEAVRRESGRVDFVRERDGDSAANEFAVRTLNQYRVALKNRIGLAGAREHRVKFFASVRFLRNIIS